MNSYNTDRIIGNIIEVNADIVSKRINSKYPAFIANMIANRERKKLLRIIDKFGNSNVILTKNNLFEYFIYIYNNYDGKYGCIDKILYKIQKGIISITTNISIGELNIDISMDSNSKDMQINCFSKNKYNKAAFSVQADKLYSNKRILEDILIELNNQLKSDLYNYIKSCISKYNRKEKGYGRIKTEWF